MSTTTEVQQLEDEIKKLNESLEALQKEIDQSKKEELKTINIVDGYLHHIKSVIYERSTTLMKNSCEQIETIKKLLDISTIKCCLVGLPGAGKSTWLNSFVRHALVPTGGEGDHVTNCITKLVHGYEYQVHIKYVSEKQFNTRINMLTNLDEKRKYTFQLLNNKTIDFSNKEDLVEFIASFRETLKGNMNLKSRHQMEKNLIVVDTPGMGSSEGKVYEVLAVETARSSDVVLYFSTCVRYHEIPQTIQDFVGLVTLDHKVHAFPPSFKYMCGGVNIHSSKDMFLNYVSTYFSKNKIDPQFQEIVYREFNFCGDDKLPIQRVRNHSLVVDLKEFCNGLVSSFGTIVLPHFASANYDVSNQLSEASFKHEMMQERKRKLFNSRVTIRMIIVSLIPHLNHAAKTIKSEKDDDELVDLETILMNKMKSTLASLAKVKEQTLLEEGVSLTSFTNMFHRMRTVMDKKSFEMHTETFLQQEKKYHDYRKSKKSPRDKRAKLICKSVTFLIDSCNETLQKLQEKWGYLFEEISSDDERKRRLEEDFIEVSKHFMTIFNPKNDHRFILGKKILDDLSSILHDYKTKPFFKYDYDITTTYPMPKKLEGNLSPPLKDLLYEDYVKLKMLAGSDYCNRYNVEPHPWSEISKVLIEKTVSDIQPLEDLIPTIVVDQDKRTVTFRNPPSIPNLELFQDICQHQTRIHPVFIIAPHGEREVFWPNLLITSLHSSCETNSIPHLIFVVTTMKNVQYYKRLTSRQSNYYVIAIEDLSNTLNLSIQFLETVCLILSSKHFKFEIITITNEDVGKIYEYLPKVTDFKGEKFTILRYLKNEDNQTDYEMKFVKRMFSQDRGKFSITRNPKLKNVYDYEKTNYIQANLHESISTYFMPAMNGVYPLFFR